MITITYDPSIYDDKITVLQQLETLKKDTATNFESVQNELINQEVKLNAIEDSLTPEGLNQKIEGSETVVVDVNEAGTALEVHLDGEVIEKVDRALLTPMTAPVEESVVSIGTNNAQNLIPLSQLGGGGKLYHYLWTISWTENEHESKYLKLSFYSTNDSLENPNLFSPSSEFNNISDRAVGIYENYLINSPVYFDSQASAFRILDNTSNATTLWLGMLAEVYSAVSTLIKKEV